MRVASDFLSTKKYKIDRSERSESHNLRPKLWGGGRIKRFGFGASTLQLKYTIKIVGFWAHFLFIKKRKNYYYNYNTITIEWLAIFLSKKGLKNFSRRLFNN